MSSTYRITSFLTVVSVCASIGNAASESMCFKDQSEFSNYCLTQHGGIAVSGRCFFLTPDPIMFDQGFDACKSINATFAQIHTSLEFNAITEAFRKTNWFLIPMRRDADNEENACSIVAGTTYWYDDDAKPNPKLVAGNTWIMTRKCDDISMHTIHKDGTVTSEPVYVVSKGRVFDVEAERQGPALCQFSNNILEYKISEGLSVDQAIVTSLTKSNPTECAGACAKANWCRGFSMNTKTDKCDMVSWALMDNPQQHSDPDVDFYTNF